MTPLVKIIKWLDSSLFIINWRSPKEASFQKSTKVENCRFHLLLTLSLHPLILVSNISRRNFLKSSSLLFFAKQGKFWPGEHFSSISRGIFEKNGETFIFRNNFAAFSRVSLLEKFELWRESCISSENKERRLGRVYRLSKSSLISTWRLVFLMLVSIWFWFLPCFHRSWRFPALVSYFS